MMNGFLTRHLEDGDVNQRAFRYAVVQLLSLLILVISVGLLAFYEYVTTMFGQPVGLALNLFPDLGRAVALLSAAVFLGAGYFTAKSLVATG